MAKSNHNKYVSYPDWFGSSTSQPTQQQQVTQTIFYGSGGSSGDSGGAGLTGVVTQGSGNAVTSGMLDGTTLVLNKDLTFITEQSRPLEGFWELRQTIDGKEYLYANYDIATLGGHTMYVDGDAELNIPSIYDGLPIDGDTIYWEITEDGRILKAKSTGGSGGSEDIDVNWVVSIITNAGFATQTWVKNALSDYVNITDYQEITGVKNFLNGLQIAGLPITKLNGYEDVIYIDANVVVRGGLTMYSTGEADIPSLTKSVVTDGITILNDNGVLKINPDIQLGGITEEEMQAIVNLINTKWTTDNTKISHWDAAYSWGNHANAGYATKEYVDGTFVTFEKDEIITGLKTFTKGIQIGSSKININQLQDDILYIDSNVVIRGGLTMYYEDGEIDLPTIKDEIGPAGYDGATGLASFNSSQFSISSDGTVTIIGGSTGLDTAQLKDYLDSNKYTTETWVKAQGYASASSLSSLQTKVDNFLEGSDTDTIINKWKELEAFLSGLSESDNLATILSTKWTTDNNLINQWNTAYGWGDHSKVGYALKSYVDNTFVTIAGNEDVTGIHNFVNGLKIGGVKLSCTTDDIIYLEGNLVVRGGVTMYALDDATVDSIIGELPLASTSELGIAKFNPSNFIINEDGFVTIISGSGGLDTEGLEHYLTTNKYATQDWVEDKGYITSSALNGYATQSWVTNQKYITGITSAMVVSALGFTPYNSANFTKTNIKTTLGISDWALASSKPSYTTSEVTEGSRLYFTNQRAIDALTLTLKSYATDTELSSGLATKADKTINISAGTGLTGGGTLAANRTLSLATSGVSAGTYKSVTVDTYGRVTAGSNPTTLAGYGITDAYTKQQLDNTFALYIPIAGYTNVTGEKNFTGGLRVNNSPSIYYDATNKYWKLEGDLLVTGGVTMYGTDEGDIPSTPSSVSILGDLQDVSSSVSGTTNSDVVLFKSANTSTWTTKLLSEIGGGSIQQPLRWTGYDSGMWDGTSDGLIVIPTSLKNPNAITFTGAVSATYDGSSAVTVNIPTAGGNIDLSNYLPLSGGTITSSSITPLLVKGKHSSKAVTIRLSNIDREVADFGYTSSDGVYIQDFISGYYIGVKTDGTPYFWNGSHRTLLHSGNYSSYALPKDGTAVSASKVTNALSWSGYSSGSYNGSSAKSISIPSNTNQLTNGAGFITSSALSSYLPLSGGTLTGKLTIDNGNLIINSASENPEIGFNRGGTWKGSLSVDSSGNLCYYSSNHNNWDIVLNSHNYSSYALPLSGGTCRWINIDYTSYLGAENSVFIIKRKESGRFIESQGAVDYFKEVYNFTNTGTISHIHVFNKGTSYISALQTSSSSPNLDIGGCSVTIGSWTGSKFYFDTENIRLGIGTPKPRYSLHVNGSTIGTTYLLYDETVGINTYNIGAITASVSYGLNIEGPTTGTTSSGTIMPIYMTWRGGYSTHGGLRLSAGGNLLVTGGITMYSDIRKKTKLQDVELSLSQIANAPLIQHYYNSDQNKTTHVGSIAQYWAELNDWFCKLDNEGFYTMEIQNCALASAISIARHLEKYESKTDKKIRMLKKRVQELEEEVEQLKHN